MERRLTRAEIGWRELLAVDIEHLNLRYVELHYEMRNESGRTSFRAAKPL
jgi:hypothetical protein